MSMTAPKYAALAGQLLERVQRDAAGPPSPEDRAHAIAQIEQAIRRTNRRRRIVRSSWAAAAIIALGLGAARYAGRGATVLTLPRTTAVASAITVIGHPLGGGATVIDTSSSTPLAEGRSLSPGNRILARPDGHVALTLSTGTELTVEEGADVSIVESDANQVFAVRVGALRAHVAKLDEHQRFIVQTPDTEVEVRGTSFHVAIAESDPACGEGTITRVKVDEGVVSVRHNEQEVRVAAGQEWPSGCSARASAPTVTRPARGGPVAVPSHAAASAPTSGVESPSASDLGEQNDAFARALSAKKRGATAEAVEDFEQFVARYPSSQLVESALAQRMQLLRGIDPARATAAAEQYLARYPKGFARSEAEALRRSAP
jgi:hypothetical protein